MQSTISVIIPVYKVEEYLEECLRSVINQTYNNLEIILVDDGSPDHCPQLCDEWSSKDSRIKVIHKENGGLSDARNAGMSIATGEYIAFVDSDDYIAPTMYEQLLKGFSYAEKQEAQRKIQNLQSSGLNPNFLFSNFEHSIKSIHYWIFKNFTYKIIQKFFIICCKYKSNFIWFHSII